MELSTDNSLYAPYRLSLRDVYETWSFACSIDTEEFTKDDFELDSQVIIRLLAELKMKIEEVRRGRRVEEG